MKNRHGSPVLEGWTEENCHENWTKELEKMLHYFKESQEKTCSEINAYDGLVDFESFFLPSDCKGCRTTHYKDTSEKAEELRHEYCKRSAEIDAYKRENRKKGLGMLVKYYDHLWD